MNLSIELKTGEFIIGDWSEFFSMFNNVTAILWFVKNNAANS